MRRLEEFHQKPWHEVLDGGHESPLHYGICLITEQPIMKSAFARANPWPLYARALRTVHMASSAAFNSMRWESSDLKAFCCWMNSTLDVLVASEQSWSAW